MANEKIEIVEKITIFNQSGKALYPKGLAIHSTANPGATAMNHYSYFNGGNRRANCHYFVDWNDTNYIVRLVKESHQAWHLGGPIGNGNYLGIEMCEAKNKADFNKVWRRTILLAVDIMKRYGFDIDDVFGHREHSLKTKESTHIDPHPYFERFNKTWEDFIKDLQKELNGNASFNSEKPKKNKKTHKIQKGETLWGISRDYNIKIDELYRLNPNIKATALQVGQEIALQEGEEIKIEKKVPVLPDGILKQGSKGRNVELLQLALNELHHHVAVDGSFGPATKSAVKRVQTQFNIVSDGIYGPNTKKAMEKHLNE